MAEQLRLFPADPPPPPRPVRPGPPGGLRQLAQRMGAEAIRRHDPQIAAWTIVLLDALRAGHDID